MEKLSSLSISFDRVLIQLVMPGVVAIITWIPVILGDCSGLVKLLEHHSTTKQFLTSNFITSISTLILIGLIVGMILENLGSLIESRIIDKILSRKDANFYTTWFKYLRLNFDGNEPIGQRYISSIILRLKFELSFSLAIGSFTIGLISLNHNHEIFPWTCKNEFFFYVFPFIVAIYLLVEAYQSAKIIAKVRKELVEQYFIV